MLPAPRHRDSPILFAAHETRIDWCQSNANMLDVQTTDTPVTQNAVFSMFGGGAKKEKKDEDEDRGDNSGSAKAQRDAAAAAKEGDEVSSISPPGSPIVP